MNRLNIERMSLRLHGVSTDIAQAALDGLDLEITRRLQMRGLDASALSTLANNLRLPTIQSAVLLDAQTLRRHIADGIISLLSAGAVDNNIKQNTGDNI